MQIGRDREKEQNPAAPKSRVAHVLRGFDAFNARDVDAFVEQFDPGLEWHFNPAFPGNEGRVIHGRAGLRDYVHNDIDGLWRSFRASPKEIYDVGEQVLVAVHIVGAGFTSGVRVDMTIYDVLRYDEEGRVVRRDSFVDRAAAFAAVEDADSRSCRPVWQSA